jgi:methylmalonyl-CoA/ethylmalonyl-CoA epimerase
MVLVAGRRPHEHSSAAGRPENLVTPDAQIAHVGIAVPSIAAALPFFRDVLGLVPHAPEVVDGATIVALPFGEALVELLEPRTPDSPVAKFLARRGPGIHHLCYRVPDLDQALARCREAGYQLIDEVPRTGVGGRRIAFLHPSATAGILYELTEA